jgi:hypothetical protein
MSNILIVEAANHVAHGHLQEVLSSSGSLSVTVSETVPVELDTYSAVILNSLPRDQALPQDRLVSYVQNGGGLVCIHDTLFPEQHNQALLSAAGVRYAFEAITAQNQDGRITRIFHLATGDPSNPSLRFPLRVVAENATHPIVEGVEDFEVADELWAINTAPGVKVLLNADVGDRVPCHERFRQPTPVLGCRGLGEGRLVFFLIGHYKETYEDPKIEQMIERAVRWAIGDLTEGEYSFDLFLSFSSVNTTEANKLYDAAVTKGLKVFMSEKDLASGDVWDEEIRKALLTSREMAVLVTPASLKSEWVVTEWGIAWALQKRITPVLLRCDINQLPERLKRYTARDLHESNLLFEEILSRKGGT